MRKLILVSMVMVLIAVACGSDTATTTTAPAVTTTSTTSVAPAATGAASGNATPSTSGPEAGSTSTTTTTMPVQIEGDPAPGFSLVLSDGTEFTLAGEERPVYLVFWAEWCPTCKRELPVVDALAQEYGERVAFVAVAGKSDFATTEQEANRLFSPFVVWGLDDSIWDLYQVPYQPASFFITGDDVIIESYAGPVPEDEMRAWLDELVRIAG